MSKSHHSYYHFNDNESASCHLQLHLHYCSVYRDHFIYVHSSFFPRGILTLITALSDNLSYAEYRNLFAMKQKLPITCTSSQEGADVILCSYKIWVNLNVIKFEWIRYLHRLFFDKDWIICRLQSSQNLDPCCLCENEILISYT